MPKIFHDLNAESSVNFLLKILSNLGKTWDYCWKNQCFPNIVTVLFLVHYILGIFFKNSLESLVTFSWFFSNYLQNVFEHSLESSWIFPAESSLDIPQYGKTTTFLGILWKIPRIVLSICCVPYIPWVSISLGL